MSDARIQEILVATAGLFGAERRAEIERLCCGDSRLKAAVMRLVHLEGRASNEESATGDAAAPLATTDEIRPVPRLLDPDGLPTPESIGRYRILGVIGEGGFGVVYRAEQSEPVRRQVAVKVIKPGMDSKAVVSRFEAERQALALMDHPGVAKVFDGGATEQGRPFFAMELVKGEPITTHCDRHKLGVRARVELFIRVCEAVQHAHHKGVVHRDLKPSNILVQYEGGKASPKVIDFGVAKALNQRLTEATIFTGQGQLIGTPEYMSPEQAEMSGTDIDTRSDVYSLGVLLYELLTGQRPFDGTSLRAAALLEIQRIIREVDPPKPSTRLSTAAEADTIAASRGTEARSLSSILRRDLDWVCMKCLEKDRERRYDTANALAEDLRRFLGDQPVLAGPPSASYRLGKFVRRNRGSVVAGSLVAATLLLATGVSIAFAVLADQQRERAEGEWERAEGLLVERDAALADEQERSEQLQIVADFQAEQLGSVDAAAMGLGLRERIVGDFTDRLERDGIAPDEAVRLGDELDASLARVDFTGLALASLEEHVFNPALDVIEHRFDGQPLVQAQLQQGLADALRRAGLLQAAEAPQTEALGTRRRVLGDEHPDTLTSINNMGFLLEQLGRLAEAEPHLREALDSRRRLLGDEHPDTLISIGNMGFLCHAQGRFAEAEPYYREALATRRRVLGDEHPNTLTSIINMGSLLHAQGRAAEAEPFYREALDTSRRVLGDRHPLTVTSIANMGFLVGSRGRLGEAESYLREALDAGRRVLGDEHPDTLKCITNMGFLLQTQGRLAEAEPYYREAVDTRRRVLGDQHPLTRDSIDRFARLLIARGRLAAAEPLAIDLERLSREDFGATHPETIAAIKLLIDLYAAWHRTEPGAGHAAVAAEWQAKLDQTNQGTPDN